MYEIMEIIIFLTVITGLRRVKDKNSELCSGAKGIAYHLVGRRLVEVYVTRY
jgi:hypothetical protein